MGGERRGVVPHDGQVVLSHKTQVFGDDRRGSENVGEVCYRLGFSGLSATVYIHLLVECPSPEVIRLSKDIGL